MLYCKKHDLAFCETHKGQCMLHDCVLVEEPRASFCAICCHRLTPIEDHKIPVPTYEQLKDRLAAAERELAEWQRYRLVIYDALKLFNVFLEGALRAKEALDHFKTYLDKAPKAADERVHTWKPGPPLDTGQNQDQG